MKAVFFDTDDNTMEYMKHKTLEGVEIVYTPDSLELHKDISGFSDADIISVFVHSGNISREVLEKFPNLKMIATRSTGFNNINIDYCRENGIAVCNTPSYGGTTVAEFTFGLLLDVVKKISKSAKDFREHDIGIENYMSMDLQGKTLGVIGTGAIGRGTIRIATGFGMNILAYDPYPSDEVSSNPNAKYVSMDELLGNSDIITLHIPSTKENYHLISDAEFAKMKDNVYIVNTARGDLIDTTSLYAGLMSGKVAGAGLDVTEYENFLIQSDTYTRKAQDFHKDEMFKSLLNMKLMQHENVIITPHIAFNSIDALYRILDITLHNIENFKKGNIINSVLGS